ncbi:MAG: 50S ribosomal protein L13 [Candidatus Peregrinibacteria bacterium]|nr:50S ribosomal protein L13 [Candidatus Peregrinibacteria bacterium]
MKATQFAKKEDFKRQWYLVDAENIVLGKLATQVAVALRGKDKASFSPQTDCGDYVIVINAEKIALTGNKIDQKLYRSHSGYIGNLKESTAREVMGKQPKRIITEAVYGMLPKNKLRKHFMNKLHIYAGSEHKHEGQQPVKLEIK